MSRADEDLESLSREELVQEVLRLREGIRRHRDSTGHELCWHHPHLWGLLPETTDSIPDVRSGHSSCAAAFRYRQSLDDQIPSAHPISHEYRDCQALPLVTARAPWGLYPPIGTSGFSAGLV